MFCRSLTLLAALCLGAATLTAASEGTVKAESLAIRAKPAASAAQVGTLVRGEKVTLLTPENGWYKIVLPATDVWISADLVADGKITASAANLRHSPSTSGVILGKAVRDTKVEVVDTATEGWLKIKCPAGVTLTGYVHADYLETKPADTATATETPPPGTGKPASLDAIRAKLKDYLADETGREVTITGYIAPLPEVEGFFGFGFTAWEFKGDGKPLRYMGFIYAKEDLAKYNNKKIRIRATEYKIAGDTKWPPIYQVIKVNEVN